ncbi:hypothetical protein HWV62_1112 [Athelia sp. TMB]|nr:hypothetical protein HWV62_1112 [Athelia sp. TMB]
MNEGKTVSTDSFKTLKRSTCFDKKVEGLGHGKQWQSEADDTREEADLNVPEQLRQPDRVWHERLERDSQL